jgi:hypothetical protein
MAANARNRRLEPAYKQHTAVDDKVGVILDVAPDWSNERRLTEPQVEDVEATTGIRIDTVTADAGYAYAKVYGALERRGIDALIPAKAEPIKSRVPLRRFRSDARHDILRCPKGRILQPGRPIKHGRSFYSKPKDCARCPLKREDGSGSSSERGQGPGEDRHEPLRERRPALCGLRREMVWRLEDERAHLQAAPAHMLLRQSKTGAASEFPSWAIKEPPAKAKQSVLVLTTKGGRAWTEDGFRASLEQGVPGGRYLGLTFHDLRGTAVTRLAPGQRARVRWPLPRGQSWNANSQLRSQRVNPVQLEERKKAQ